MPPEPPVTTATAMRVSLRGRWPSDAPCHAPASASTPIIVGAGISGLYLLHRLRELGLSVLVIDQATGVGGTWFWNRYPGARCDIESMTYSYSWSHELEQEWTWIGALRRPARDPALPRARRRSLRPAPRHPARHARRPRRRFDEAERRAGRSTTDAGDAALRRLPDHGDRAASRFRASPTSRASSASRGEMHHTGLWPHEGVDFAGKRVGVIGTGSSAVQAIPVIAAEAAQLTVFQRTANFSVPAWNGPLDAEAIGERKARYAVLRRWRARPAAGNPVERARAERLGRDARGARARVRGALRRRRLLPPLGLLRPLPRIPRRTTCCASSCARRSASACDDPELAELLCPYDHPARHQADVRRHGLLRDVQPPQRAARLDPRDRRSTRSPSAGCASATSSSRSTRSCSARASTR